MKRGAILEDRRRATEGRIQAHVQAVQVLKNATKTSSSSCIPRFHCTSPLCASPPNQTSAKHKITTTTLSTATIFPPNYVIFERMNNVHVNANRVETGLKLVSLTRVSCACERGVTSQIPPGCPGNMIQ